MFIVIIPMTFNRLQTHYILFSSAQTENEARFLYEMHYGMKCPYEIKEVTPEIYNKYKAVMRLKVISLRISELSKKPYSINLVNVMSTLCNQLSELENFLGLEKHYVIYELGIEILERSY